MLPSLSRAPPSVTPHVTFSRDKPEYETLTTVVGQTSSGPIYNAVAAGQHLQVPVDGHPTAPPYAHNGQGAYAVSTIISRNHHANFTKI